MKFEVNEYGININGTHLVGEVKTTYAELVETFGEPGIGDEWKTDAEWDIRFEDGTIATIYNWKDGKNYNGEFGQDIAEIEIWNIGGFGLDAPTLVHKALGYKDY